MKVLINQQNGRWLTEVDGVPHLLRNEVTIPVNVLVGAIRHFHPEADIDLHANLLVNPLLRAWRADAPSDLPMWWWESAGKVLLHNYPVVCDRCGGNAWLAPGFRGYECLKCRGKHLCNGPHGTWGLVKSSAPDGDGPDLRDRLSDWLYNRQTPLEEIPF